MFGVKVIHNTEFNSSVHSLVHPSHPSQLIHNHDTPDNIETLIYGNKHTGMILVLVLRGNRLSSALAVVLGAFTNNQSFRLRLTPVGVSNSSNPLSLCFFHFPPISISTTDDKSCWVHRSTGFCIWQATREFDLPKDLSVHHNCYVSPRMIRNWALFFLTRLDSILTRCPNHYFLLRVGRPSI